MQRQKAFASNAPNDQIHLHDRRKRVFERVVQIVFACPPLPALGVRFVLLAFALSRLETTGVAV